MTRRPLEPLGSRNGPCYNFGSLLGRPGRLSGLLPLVETLTVASRWDRVAVIGVGLLGGSIALALRRRGLCESVVGIGRDSSKLQRAVETGVLDEGTTDLAAGVADADVVLVATPVDHVVPYVRAAAEGARRARLITDVGSVKASIVEALGDLSPDVPFVGSHPLAGSEQSGFEHASPELLEGRVVFVTPTERTRSDVTGEARAFWESLGARVESIDAAEHDRVMAAVSHLPHLVASALAAAVPDFPAHYFGTGFRDTTRLASGSVAMWVPILLQNRTAIAEAWKRFREMVETWEEALDTPDPNRLADLLTEGKRRRDALGS